MDESKSLKFITSLLKGESVKCPQCNLGVLKTDVEPSKSHFFYCPHCGNTVNID